jgi:hypothetical protein
MEYPSQLRRFIMMYLVELLTTMTLVHNIDVVPSSEEQAQSITANNSKKKGSGSSSSNKSSSGSKSSKSSGKKSSGSKKSKSSSSKSKSSSHSSAGRAPVKKNTTSSTNKGRPPTKSTTTSRSSSSRPPTKSTTTTRTSSSRPPTKSTTTTRTSSSRPPSKSTTTTRTSSSRPPTKSTTTTRTSSSRSSSSSKPTHSKTHPNSRSTQGSKSPSVSFTHPSQKTGHSSNQKSNNQQGKGPTYDPSQRGDQNKSLKKGESKKPKGPQNPKSSFSPDKINKMKESKKSHDNKPSQNNRPHDSIQDHRIGPQHKPTVTPNRGNRYDPSTDRGNSGVTNKGKMNNRNSNIGNQGSGQTIESQSTDNNSNGSFGSARSNTIVVVKPSSTPQGWNPEIHREASGEDRHWHPNHWGAGVFYYTEPAQNVYIEEHNYYGDTVKRYDAPSRKHDRRKSLSVGVRGGSLGSQVENFSQDDISWGGAVGYRLFDPIGLEVSYLKTGDEWTTGLKAPAQVSGNLYLFPWTGVSPYLTGGISIAEQAGAKNQTDFDLPDGYAYGPHGGIGVEWGIGNHISLNAEGRYTKFKNVDATHTQISAGLNFYF